MSKKTGQNKVTGSDFENAADESAGFIWVTIEDSTVPLSHDGETAGEAPNATTAVTRRSTTAESASTEIQTATDEDIEAAFDTSVQYDRSTTEVDPPPDAGGNDTTAIESETAEDSFETASTARHATYNAQSSPTDGQSTGPTDELTQPTGVLSRLRSAVGWPF